MSYSNTTMAMIMCVGGMYRIVNNKGQIGYANPNGRTVIEPRFAFRFPFKVKKGKGLLIRENEKRTRLQQGALVLGAT